MAISIHPYLTGVPHRIKYLEMLYDHIRARDGVVMWTGSEIVDWNWSDRRKLGDRIGSWVQLRGRQTSADHVFNA